MTAPHRHLLHVIPSFRIGGVPVRIARLINHFGMRYRHTILSLDGQLEARALLRKDLAVEVCGAHLGEHRSSANPLALRRTLKARRPDLLITYNWGAIDWAAANRFAPICTHIHQEDGFGVEEAERQLARRALYRRLTLGGARLVIVPSRTLAEIARSSWRVAACKLRYLPNGIDVARFAEAGPSAALAGLRERSDELVLGTVAPLRPEKALDRLLRVFAEIAQKKPVRLVIAGDGSERQRLETSARELGLGSRITFLGNVTHPETVLKLFDVFAICSDTEQMPTTVIEAMASGLPVAGLDVGDIKAMVAVENKPYIAPRGDERAFGEAICALLERADTRRRLGDANYGKAVRQFSQDQMFAAYDDIYAG